MRNAFLAALAVLPLMSGAAFAGVEQIYEGPSTPLIGGSAGTETGTEAQFARGPIRTISESRVVTRDTGNERAAEFTGLAASLRNGAGCGSASSSSSVTGQV